MEAAAAAAATAAGSSGLPPPEMMIAPSQRGQKRGAPDEDEAAGDGAARGSPRRAAGADAVAEEEKELSMESEEEEEDHYDDDDEPKVFDAPPDRQLLDYLRVHPCAGAASGSPTTAGQAREPVDVTLRLGAGPLADDDTVDTTLSLRLGPAPPPPAAAASDADLFHAPWLLMEPEDEAILLEVQQYGTKTDCSAAAAAATAGDAAGRRRPSRVLDMNRLCSSESPDGALDPSQVPDPAAADDDERRRPSTPFDDFFCGRGQDLRAPPGVLTADST